MYTNLVGINVVFLLISLNVSSLKMSVPRLIAFDLDGTIWYPDMYMLWGGGSPFQIEDSAGSRLLDRNGKSVKLLGICSSLFEELATEPRWKETKLAWVSCTDEPDWAAECLSKFKTISGISIESVVHSSQIFKDDKRTHFRRLKELFPSISYDEMLFFDNEMGNIRSVSKLGVRCVHCPHGITREAWQQGLSLFETI